MAIPTITDYLKYASLQMAAEAFTQLAKADERTIKNELALKSLQLRRIDAELAGLPLMRRADDSGELFRQVEAQYRDRRQSYLDARAQQKTSGSESIYLPR